MEEIVKSFRLLEDGLVAAVVVFDEINGYVDIDGDKSLKTGLFEVSAYLIKR